MDRNFKIQVDKEELIKRYLYLFQLAEIPRGNFATQREEDFIVASVLIQLSHGTSRMFTTPVLKSYEERGFSKSSVNRLVGKICNKYLAARQSGQLLLLPELLEIAKTGEMSINLEMKAN